MQDRPLRTCAESIRRSCLVCWFVLVVSVATGRSAAAQTGADAPATGGCTLKNHVYHCDGEVFAKALLAAQTVRIETDDVDGAAQGALKSLLGKKLEKKVVLDDSTPADLVFVMIPTTAEGVVNSPGNADLGTLRIYTVAADRGWGHLLWAETYSGQQDMPWPAVVHALIQQFQKDFQIK